MALEVKCDRCNRTIDDSDGDEARVVLGYGEDGPEYIYWYIGDEESEPVGRHYCMDCLRNVLAELQEQSPTEKEQREESIEDSGDGNDRGPDDADTQEVL
ncbi:MAG: hypothetical protein GF400_09695 [Candidatus Eisenbacteria bacterium]|nr:hypothetical protein [Candidatus Eisenbacteria bacterium]